MFPGVSNPRATAALVLAAAGWGLGTVLTKAALALGVPPLTLLVTQLAASAAGLGLALRFQRLSLHWNKQLLGVGALGLLNPGLAYTFSLFGLVYTTASASALLWALEPLLIVALAWALLGERLRPGFVALSAVAAGGVALAALPTGGGPGGSLAGNGLILAGVAACALYSVLARRWSTAAAPLAAVAVQQVAALVWALVLWPAEALAAGTGPALRALPAGAWALAALSGLVYYGLAFWSYLEGLRHTTASRAGVFINLVPLFALAGAYTLLGERLAPLQWVGAALVVGAVWAAEKQLAPPASEPVRA